MFEFIGIVAFFVILVFGISTCFVSIVTKDAPTYFVGLFLCLICFQLWVIGEKNTEIHNLQNKIEQHQESCPLEQTVPLENSSSM